MSKTRRKRPATPKYRLHKPSGQAVVTLSGQDFYLGQHGSATSRVFYDQTVASWLARGRRPEEHEAEALSVGQLIEPYLEWCSGHYRDRDGQPNARELQHVRRALRPLRRLFGLSQASAFGPAKLAVVRDTYVDDGLARTTANRYTRRIRHAFKWAVSRELVPATTWQSLTALDGLRRGHTDAAETRPITPVADAAVDAVRPYVSAEVWGLIELQRFSGMRPGEATDIRGQDIDMSGDLWLYRPRHHKTEHHGKDRVIVLGKLAQKAIQPFLKPDLSAYLFSPADAEARRREVLTRQRRTPLSCGNRTGTNRKRKPKKQPRDHYDVTSYRRAIREACLKVSPMPDGISDEDVKQWRSDHVWAPNQLRHSHATRVRREFGLEAAQVVLGHQNASVTQVYAERDMTLAAKVARRIG